MDTDSGSLTSKVDRWLKQLIPPDISDPKSLHKGARTKQHRKGQGQQRDHPPDQRDKILTISTSVYDTRDHDQGTNCEDRRAEVEKWISRIAASADPPLQRSHTSWDYASRSPHEHTRHRYITDHQISAGKIGHKRKKLSSEVGFEKRLEQRVERSPRFEKQSRHKTREDRYDTHHSKLTRKVAEPRADDNVDMDRQRPRKAALMNPSRDVVAKFTSDAILSKRVTTHPGPGLFGKRDPLKRPLGDLEFHDMNFLTVSAEEPGINNVSRARARERNRQDRLNEEVSAFFTKAVPVSTEPNQNYQRQTPSTEYWTISDRISPQRPDSYPPPSRQGSAGGPTPRTVNKYPSGSSKGISSPLKRELLQRLEHVACPNECNKKSSLIRSTSVGKITRSIIETGVLDGTASPRRINFTQPSNSQDFACDDALQQLVTKADSPTVPLKPWTQQSQAKASPDREHLAIQATPMRQLPSALNERSPIEQVNVPLSEDGLPVDAQGHVAFLPSSIKSPPSSIPTRPEPPKSRLVQRLQRAVDNINLPQSGEKLNGQVGTELQTDQGLRSRIVEPSISNFQPLRIGPTKPLTLLSPLPDLQADLPPRNAVDSRLHDDIARTSTSSTQNPVHNGEAFHRMQTSASPLTSQDVLVLTGHPQQLGQLGQTTDMAQYIATIENEVLGAESYSEPNDIYYDEQWGKDTETYGEPTEHRQEGCMTGQLTRLGKTLSFAFGEDTEMSMVDFWTRNPFVN